LASGIAMRTEGVARPMTPPTSVPNGANLKAVDGPSTALGMALERYRARLESLESAMADLLNRLEV